MGSSLGEVPCLVSRGLWSGSLAAWLCCVTVLSSGLWPMGLLELGTAELHGESRSKSMVPTSIFPSILFWNLEPCSQGSGSPIQFFKVTEQTHWCLICFMPCRWMFPCVHEVWLCRGLPNTARGWDRWGFLRPILIVSNKEIKWMLRRQNLVLGMRKRCSNKFQSLNPAWLCCFSWRLFIAF